MCVFSMVGDHYTGKWQDYFPGIPAPGGAGGTGQPSAAPLTPVLPASAAELDALRKEVLEMKELLRKAKLYDEKNGEKDCEKEEKIHILKKMAEVFGISMEDIFEKEKV